MLLCSAGEVGGRWIEEIEYRRSVELLINCEEREEKEIYVDY